VKADKVNRIIRLLIILQSGQRYTSDDLAKMQETSRRTLFRDLNDLKKIGVPCHYNKRDCCYIIDQGFFLSPPDLSTQEALGLLLLVKAINNINLPFKDSILQAALKIGSNLPDETRRYCNTALQHIFFKANSQTNQNLLDKTFGQLLSAIMKQHIVNVHYYLPCEVKTIVTELSPYYLIYNNRCWYVLGKSSYHKGIHIFKFAHIKKLNILDKCFINDEGFDIREYLDRAWLITPEGSLYNIKIRFAPEVVHNVIGIQWHSTQTVTFENDGSAIVEFRVNGLSEIIWWILGYGDQIEVLAPRILRQRIAKIAKGIAQVNK
jgi:predicted DNA-binding transcriptional regulator YafY